jgi:hypothetical protein
MAFHKKGKRPPNPDPGSYVWIETRDGGYWRRKRGTVKKAKPNRAFRESGDRMKQSAPATSRILKKLKPYMNGLDIGRLNAHISGLLRTSMTDTGKLSLACLDQLDFQRNQPIEWLLQVIPDIAITAHELIVSIPIVEYTLKRLNTLVTNYYFELILLFGDAGTDNGLRTESEESDVYEIAKDYKLMLTLRLVLPEKPWIALLKVNSIEENEHAKLWRLYGMKVIGAGAGISPAVE